MVVAVRVRVDCRSHAGRGRAAVFGDARADSADRGEGAAEAEASVEEQEVKELSGSVNDGLSLM